MNATAGDPEGVPPNDAAIPNVTQIPLLDLEFGDDRVLDAAIRRQQEDILAEYEITAGFGAIP